jgi:hypothetical protein
MVSNLILISLTILLATSFEIKNSMTTQYKITFSFSVMIFLLVLGSGVAIFNVLKLANLAEDMYKHHLVASNIVREGVALK